MQVQNTHLQTTENQLSHHAMNLSDMTEYSLIEIPDGRRFRVCRNAFKRSKIMMGCICGLFSSFIFAIGFLLMDWALRLQGFLFGGSILFTSLVMCILLIQKRKYLQPLLLFSSFLWTLFILTSLIFQLKSYHLLGYLSTGFGILQIILSLFFSLEKGKIFVTMLFFLHIALSGFKIDGLILAEWSQLMFGLILIFSTLSLLALVLIIFLMSTIEVDHHRCCLMKQRMVFTVLNLLSSAFLLFIPISYFYIENDLTIPSIIAILILIANCLYACIYQQEIAINWCQNFQIVQNPNQTVVPILSEKNKEEYFKNQSGKYIMYRVTDNWFASNHDQIEFSGSKIQEEEVECLICITQKANTICMPCGHLTLCMNCHEQMISNRKKVDCVLCKQKVQELLIIRLDYPTQQEQLENNKKDVESKVEPTINLNRQFEVQKILGISYQ